MLKDPQTSPDIDLPDITRTTSRSTGASGQNGGNRKLALRIVR